MTDVYPIEIGLLSEIDDPLEDNVDVQVVLSDGSRYTATFFTLKNVAKIMDGYASSGECLSGSFFWAKDMIVVRELTHPQISKVVWELLTTGELFTAMTKADSA